VPSAPTAEIPHTLHVYSGYPGYICDTGGLPTTVLSAGHVSSSGTPETHGLSTTVGVQLSPEAMYSHPMTGVAAHSAHPGLGVSDEELPVVVVTVVLVAVVEVSETVSVVLLTEKELLLAVADESVVEVLCVADRLDSVVADTLIVVNEIPEMEVTERESDEREVAEMEVGVVEVRVEVVDWVEV